MPRLAPARRSLRQIREPPYEPPLEPEVRLRQRRYAGRDGRAGHSTDGKARRDSPLASLASFRQAGKFIRDFCRKQTNVDHVTEFRLLADILV